MNIKRYTMCLALGAFGSLCAGDSSLSRNTAQQGADVTKMSVADFFKNDLHKDPQATDIFLHKQLVSGPGEVASFLEKVNSMKPTSELCDFWKSPSEKYKTWTLISEHLSNEEKIKTEKRKIKSKYGGREQLVQTSKALLNVCPQAAEGESNSFASQLLIKINKTSSSGSPSAPSSSSSSHDRHYNDLDGNESQSPSSYLS